MDPAAPSPFTADSRWFVRVGDDVRGPLTPDALRQLAEVELLKPETPLSLAANGPWQPLSAYPGGTLLLPSRRTFRFSAPPPPGPDAGVSTGITVKDSFLAATGPLGHLQGDGRFVSPPISPARSEEIVAMVREVAAIEAKLKPGVPLDIRRRPNKRLVHYLILMVLGNAVLAAIPLYYGGPFDEFVIIVLTGWFGLYNAGLAMIMFLHVPRY